MARDYMKVVIYCDNVMDKDLDDLKEYAKEALNEDRDVWFVETVSPREDKKPIEKLYVT